MKAIPILHDKQTFGDIETPYTFRTVAQLIADFWKDVYEWAP